LSFLPGGNDEVSIYISSPQAPHLNSVVVGKLLPKEGKKVSGYFIEAPCPDIASLKELAQILPPKPIVESIVIENDNGAINGSENENEDDEAKRESEAEAEAEPEPDMEPDGGEGEGAIEEEVEAKPIVLRELYMGVMLDATTPPSVEDCVKITLYNDPTILTDDGLILTPKGKKKNIKPPQT
jgi:hypothetical protein